MMSEENRDSTTSSERSPDAADVYKAAQIVLHCTVQQSLRGGVSVDGPFGVGVADWKPSTSQAQDPRAKRMRVFRH
jgi:hypothetical protein